jgi:hypothetical protein
MPKLRVVSGDQTGNKPTRKLGRHGGQLWKNVMDEYQIEDVGGVELLVSACAALDRAEACRATIDRDGEMIRSKVGPREHPLLRHELASRAFVVKTLRTLGLNVEGSIRPGPGRPPPAVGWIPDEER